MDGAAPGGSAWPDALAAAALPLARRFAAGATLWCLAPGRPSTPSTSPSSSCTRSSWASGRCRRCASTAGDPVAAAARRRPRPATCSLVVAPATTRRRRVLRRAPAWGLTTHLARRRARARRPATADHVLWLDDDDGAAPPRRPARARLPRAVGAHPRVLRAPRPARRRRSECADGTTCITCSRRGPPGRGGRGRRRRRRRRCAPPAASRRSTPRSSVTSSPATWCSCTPAPPSTRGRTTVADDRLPLPVHRGRRARRRPRCSTTWPRPPRPRPTASAALAGDDPRPPRRRASSTTRRRHGRPASRAAAGCSPSATAAAPPTPPARRAVHPPAARPRRCRPAAWSTTSAVLTALGNDVGFDLVFSRQLIAHGRPGDIALGLSTSGSSRNLLAAFAEASAGACSRRARRLRRRRMAASADVDHCLVVRVRQRPPDPGDPGRAGVRPLGSASRRLLDEGRGMPMQRRLIDGREAAVLERIEAFRRRRPRLTDEVVTLAHGAGGKASAALVDAVFLEAVRRRRRRPRPGRRRRPARCRPASGWPSAPTPSSCSPAASPAARSATSPCTAPSTTSPCSGARPAWLSAAFVIEEGFPVAELRDDRGRHGRGRGRRRRRDRRRRHQGGRRGARPTASTSRRPASASCPQGRRSAPSWCSPGDVVLVSGTIADHGMAVMLARGDLALEADIRSDTAPLGGLVEPLLAAAPGRPAGCATPPGAGSARCATSWPTPPTSPSCSTRPRCRSTRRSTAPATCSASTRSTSPTRASSSPSSPADEADAALAAAAGRTRSAPAAAVIGEIAAEPEGIVVLLTSFGGTRIVDMLVGDPLPAHLLTDVAARAGAASA